MWVTGVSRILVVMETMGINVLLGEKRELESEARILRLEAENYCDMEAEGSVYFKEEAVSELDTA
jgi:hypothetical protein